MAAFVSPGWFMRSRLPSSGLPSSGPLMAEEVVSMGTVIAKPAMSLDGFIALTLLSEPHMLVRCAFADEPRRVVVMDYRPGWPEEFERLAATLRALLGRVAAGIDHVGSTPCL